MKFIMNKLSVLGLISLFAITLGFEKNIAKAEGLQKVTIRISADIPPPPMPTSVAMEWFKKKVETEFPSGSKVRIYYAGALYKDPDAMTAMSQGNLEMGWLVSGKTAATDIWLSIVGQPGVLTTAGAVHDLINQPTGKMLQKRLKDKHNIEMFGFAGANLDPSYLKNCPSKTVIFGCVFNSAEVMEDPKEVAAQLLKASEYIDPLKLQAAPDCGLVMMNDADALKKLKILVDAAKLARQQI